MRLGLIGCTGHWRTYAEALRSLPDLEISAVAVAAPEERLAQFDGAPGVTAATRRYETPRALLDQAARGDLDALQVSTRPDVAERWVRAAIERGVPVMAEKPLATSLDTLSELYALARQNGVPVSAMHAQRGTPLVAAVREIVRSGAIGTPLLAHNQKSYRWGASRPAFFRSRQMFPGVAPYIGIHVFDWLLWILGDRFVEVSGAESAAARPEYAACASHAGYLLRLTDGGIATVTLDYLRPEGAPTHGDERIRIAGTRGVVEVAVAQEAGSLLTAEGIRPVAPAPAPEWYASFLLAVQGRAEPAIPRWEAFRATEVALKAQQAADRGRPVSLVGSPFRPEHG